MFVFLFVGFGFSQVQAHETKIPAEQVRQDDWNTAMAQSSDGKLLKVRYKINSFTQKIDIYAGFQAWDQSYSRWVTVFGGSDKFGTYVTYFSNKYYF